MASLSQIYFLLFHLTICLTNGTKELFVKPVNNFSGCSRSSKPCLTVNEYIDQRNDYFFSYTTFTFLEGYHEVNTNYVMDNLVNITLRADFNTSVSIDCRGQTMFLFNNISGLVIENIAFISCGISSDSLPGISLNSLNLAELINVTVMNSTAGGLLIHGSEISITNILIAKNTVNTNDAFSGLMSNNSILSFHGNNTFSQNGATFGGTESFCPIYYNDYYYRDYDEIDTTEAVFLAINTTLIAVGTLTVTNNTSPSAIVVFINSRIKINGESQFTGNSVCVSGALFLHNTEAILSGEVSFSHNLGSFQIFNAVAGMRSSVSTFAIFGQITFTDNSADISSVIASSSTFSVIGVTTMSGCYGYTGIELSSGSHMKMNGSSTFRNNEIVEYGGLIIAKEQSTITNIGKGLFYNTRSTPLGAFDSAIMFTGVTQFSNNSGVLYSEHSSVTFEGDSTFIQNNVQDFYIGGAIAMLRSRLFLHGKFLFQTNQGKNSDGGAIYGLKSSVTFDGVGAFLNNSGRDGGAIYLSDDPQISLQPQTVVLFENNTAGRGGAIYTVSPRRYIECITSAFEENPPCFIDIGANSSNITLVFRNNQASKFNSGDALHISLIEEVSLNLTTAYTALDRFRDVSKFERMDVASPISLDSYRLCFCLNNNIDCDLKEHKVVTRKGQRFLVSVIVMAYNLTNSKIYVRSDLSTPSENPNTSLRGNFQFLDSNVCTNLTYYLFTENEKDKIVLFVSDVERGSSLIVRVEFEDCPVGFSLDNVLNECVCNELVNAYTESCDVTTGNIKKNSKNAWIGTYRNRSNADLILYPRCPLDYCVEPSNSFHLSEPDSQCNNSRSGVLCGKCKENFSLVLGSSRCLNCSNENSKLTLIILFAILGILLVTFLFLFQLTVASGTIHGLILYANVVNADHNVFIPSDIFKGFTVFLAWLNLDFGIETCFYDGMDQIAKTAWQFVFPVYLWLIVGLIIVVCHYSIRVSKVFANSNPVGVLATIILLSYTKLLQSIIEILSVAHLQHSNNNTSTVWLYDGNIELFTNNISQETENSNNSWIVLFVIALLVLLLLFLPYTFILLSAQFLQKVSRFSSCFYKLRLTPFISAYHAPYKAAVRYWIGLCLTIRCVLLVVIATREQLSDTLLTISSFSFVLLGIISVSGGSYSSRWLDVLETSFILNLGIFSAATYHNQLTGGNQTAAAHVSVSISFITFILIIITQLIQRLKKQSWLNKIMKEKVKKRRQKSSEKDEAVDVEENSRHVVTKQEVVILTKDSSHFELREPLLEDSSL